MAFATALVTIADSIAGISISGVTVKDIDGIPDRAELTTPIMFPQPNGYVSGLAAERTTFGINGAGKTDLTYSLNYVYLHCKDGSGLGTFAIYSGLITKLAAIITAILSNDTITGAADVNIGNIGDIGIIDDPAGHKYWGVLFSLEVTEYIQA
jgi:hypothetical protein